MGRDASHALRTCEARAIHTRHKGTKLRQFKLQRQTTLKNCLLKIRVRLKIQKRFKITFPFWEMLDFIATFVVVVVVV